MTVKKVVNRDGVIKQVGTRWEPDNDAPSEEDKLLIKSLRPKTYEEQVQSLIDKAARVMEEVPEGSTSYFYAAEAMSVLEVALVRARNIESGEVLEVLREHASMLTSVFQLLWRTDVKKLEPDIVTGVKAKVQRRDAGFRSATERKAENEAKWATYQEEYDRLYARNPHLSKTAIAGKVSRKFKCSGKTIMNRCVDPRDK